MALLWAQRCSTRGIVVHGQWQPLPGGWRRPRVASDCWRPCGGRPVRSCSHTSCDPGQASRVAASVSSVGVGLPSQCRPPAQVLIPGQVRPGGLSSLVPRGAAEGAVLGSEPSGEPGLAFLVANAMEHV